jgi:HrpA-like RNA helicase
MKLFEPGSQISMWSDVTISRSSAKQRAGRCGRIPGTFGVCYHLFSKFTYEETMTEQQQPELLRMPIHELCLSAKLLAAQTCSISGNESIILFKKF